MTTASKYSPEPMCTRVLGLSPHPGHSSCLRRTPIHCARFTEFELGRTRRIMGCEMSLLLYRKVFLVVANSVAATQQLEKAASFSGSGLSDC